MPTGLLPVEVTSFFGPRAPLTGTGALRLADAYQRLGRTSDARDVAIEAWRTRIMPASEEAALLAEYGGALSRYHDARLEMLLWQGEAQAAEQMLPRVSPPRAALARARIALLRGAQGVDGLIAAVPGALADDPGLAHARFLWRIRRDRRDDAEALLLERTGSAEALGQPAAWANQRRSLARRAMRRGDIATAYRLASDHFLSPTDGYDYSDLEWLAGWLALRFQGDPDRAIRHFERFRASVETPISLGRAGYWLGRAHEAAGNARAAREAYGVGALYQTSFYGQLAALRADLPVDGSLAARGRVNWERAEVSAEPVVRAAILFHYADEPGRVWQFLTHRAERARGEGEFATLAQIALDLDRIHVAVRIAKMAAREGHILPAAYYPVTELAGYSVEIPPELAMAVARQETELNPEAVSPAGARGLMQLMPGTARDVASDLGLQFSRSRLTSDWRYNARLGTAYMAGLLQEFDYALPLAVAGYNAGPHRSDRWIAAYGDPRRADVDVVDWIETIPFRETRNYVQRVLEALHVYRLRLSGQAQPIRLDRDLGLE
ncbi:MAG: lytic transglycosylase domain-containing protein [Pseudomonadota bacterium]